MLRKAFASALMVVAAGISAAAQEAPRVTLFSPQGTVKQVRQVRAVFSDPMVSFGDPRADSPFEVQCAEEGRGRWVDPSNWLYDFERDLPAGIRCSFQLKPGLQTLAGVQVGGRRQFSFSTGGPSIRSAVPGAGHTGIDEQQVFILTLDAAPQEDSVLAHAGFAIEGIRERAGVRIIQGEDRQRILEANPWLFPDGQDPGRTLLLQCRQRFPQKARVSLVWGKGIRSASGVATGQEQVLAFRTREAFFATFHCSRESPRSGCIPVLPMRVSFNAPLSPQVAGEAVLRGPGGKTWTAAVGGGFSGVVFEGPFPPNAEFRLEIPGGVLDDAGRSLINADQFPLKVRTAGVPPLAKFASRFGIVERSAEPTLPVTLRSLVSRPAAQQGGSPGIVGRATGRVLTVPPGRLAELQPWLRRVAAANRSSSILAGETGTETFTLPGSAGTEELEVVGIPLKGPGLHIVEIESELLGKALLDPPAPMFVPAAVLVTNLSVHFKRGRESSLAWVTTLDRAEPVGGAAVTVMDCEGRLLWTGRTDADGIARIGMELPDTAGPPACRVELPAFDYPQLGALRGLGEGLFITAQAGEETSFVHTSWDEGIEAWRFKLPEGYGAGELAAHTVFDRTLLRAGETVHMKHLLRRRTMDGFDLPAAGMLPESVMIRHAGSEQRYELPLDWDASGVAESAWSIPASAKLGAYSVSLERKRLGEPPRQGEPAGNGGPEEGGAEASALDGIISGSFRVEEFRVPLLRAVVAPTAGALVNAAEASLDLSAQYLAGGPAGRLPVTLRTEVGPKRIPAFAGFEDFVFGNGPVVEGVASRTEHEPPGAESEGGRPSTLKTFEMVLDAAGAARAVVPDLPRGEMPREMMAEMEFRDPNGEVQTVSARIPLWNSGRLVGIKPDGWAVSREDLGFTVAVVDIDGKPADGASVRVELYERKTTSHRKRLVGGFYAYGHTVEIKRVALLAEGRTDAGGLFRARARSPQSGEMILVAESGDAAGNPAFSHRAVWVAGQKDWWFEVEDHDRMDLLPERERYEPGEEAVFQVRMPFREATALVSVEREGVAEAWLQTLSGRAPVVRVPIKGHYAPNVFVSVLALRGRTGEVQPTALADLGKPAFKLGIAEINVGWREHRLDVTVAADREVYAPRATARVRIKAASASGAAPPQGSEAALAAVDEGLLELAGNRSWELLAAMMGRRGCEVQTATAQMQVVGKRHYGVKARPQGGGGGRRATRELFDTLLLWKGRVALNAQGEADVEVPLNDSVTAFRIVAVASGGKGLFGTGSTSIRSARELALFSGLPPLVREGDRFRAGVTVRNTSRRSMAVEVSATALGVSPPPAPQPVSLAPGEASEVAWDVAVDPGMQEVAWELDAATGDGHARDRIRVVQKVAPAVPLRVFQASLSRLEAPLKLPVERPRDAAADRGGVRVGVRARLADGLGAVADYMRGYPYGCMEQKLSAAVAQRDRNQWDRWVAQMPAYMDGEGLVKYFPSTPLGDPVLTAYIVAVSHEAGWGLPDDLRERAAAGLKRFVEGSLLRYPPLPTADLTIRKLAAIEALSRIGRADPKHLASVPAALDLWPTSAVIDWVNILLNLTDVPGRDERIAAADQVLRTRLTYQGTVMGFSTAASDRLWWLMVSEDVNAVRMLLTVFRLEGWRKEVPRLVRGALARQRGGRWDLTTANAWGVLAMERFSREFEAEPVTGATRIELAGGGRRIDWGVQPQGDSALLPWPAGLSAMSAVHEGGGAPWLALQSLAAVPLRKPLSNGYAITRTVSAVDRRTPERWSRGDVLRVKLEIEAQADMTWVAVSDPVPAGAVILGSGLGRDSRLLSRGEERIGRVWPSYEERSFESFRAYYEVAPKGAWSIEYTLRLNQAGFFQMPPTRVEALYAPEVFGEAPNDPIEVGP